MIVVDNELCCGCGTCVSDCISNNIEIKNHKAHILSDCFQCGHCVALCPQGALSISNYSDTCIPYNPETFDVPTENLLNMIKFRRSIRTFKQKTLSYRDLHLLMEAGAHTPTAKNVQGCRFVFIQDSLQKVKQTVWQNLRLALHDDKPTAIPNETLQRFVALKDASPSVDYLFRNAPAILLIQAPDPLDAGLAAQAIELVGTTRGIGTLYNGYLRRTFLSMPDVLSYLDMDVEEKPLHACLLLGYSDISYLRTAPRRNPSVVLR